MAEINIEFTVSTPETFAAMLWAIAANESARIMGADSALPDFHRLDPADALHAVWISVYTKLGEAMHDAVVQAWTGGVEAGKQAAVLATIAEPPTTLN